VWYPFGTIGAIPFIGICPFTIIGLPTLPTLARGVGTAKRGVVANRGVVASTVCAGLAN